MITESDLTKTLKELEAEDPDAIWVCASKWRTNIPVFAGIPTLNSTNIYPNLDLWNYLDPDKARESEWNRYLHIRVEIVEEPPSFELLVQDTIKIWISPRDLANLGVRYILNDTDPNDIVGNDSSLKEIRREGFYHIYRIL